MCLQWICTAECQNQRGLRAITTSKSSIQTCYRPTTTKLHLKKYKLIGVRLLNLSESSYPMGPLGSTGYMHQQTESTIDSGLSSHPVQVRRKQGIVHHRTHHIQTHKYITNKYANPYPYTGNQEV